MDVKSLVIGVLAVAVVVLGYLLWDANQTKIKVDLPGIKIEGRLASRAIDSRPCRLNLAAAG